MTAMRQQCSILLSYYSHLQISPVQTSSLDVIYSSYGSLRGPKWSLAVRVLRTTQLSAQCAALGAMLVISPLKKCFKETFSLDITKEGFRP